jgi:hypothetical protein
MTTATTAASTNASQSTEAGAGTSTATPAKKAAPKKAAAATTVVKVKSNSSGSSHQPVRHLKATKTKVVISQRAVREGTRTSISKFLETLGNKTKKNLETLANKFGITWEYAIDAKAPKDSTGPARPFVVVGKSNTGEVFYDRAQLSIFTNGHKERIANVLTMNKKQFEKLGQS